MAGPGTSPGFSLTTPLTKTPTGVSPVVSQSLSESMKKAIDNIPADKAGYMEFDATTKGLELEFGHKFTQDWVLGAYGSRDWQGGLEAGVRVRGAW